MRKGGEAPLAGGAESTSRASGVGWHRSCPRRGGKRPRGFARAVPQLMRTGRCSDLPPFRLPLFLDRGHFRGCPKLGCPIPQVDYHALISERKNRHLGRLFCLGWSWENGYFICHGTPRYLSRRADRGAYALIKRRELCSISRRACNSLGFP